LRNFELKIDGDSEDHQFALDLIENLISVGEKDGLSDEILMEVAMVYSVGFNLLHGNKKLMHSLLSDAIEKLEQDPEIRSKSSEMLH
jgi:hypothetical protein